MLPGEVIWQSKHLSARFVEGETERVVVCFPDRVHPTGFDQPGWGEGFLGKRGISAIYISVARIDWFQCPEFFDAMQACRNHLGKTRPVSTYGSSMGGYGAILGAQALGAKLCLVLSPQYSIDPQVVPFERRYNDYAARIGPFVHDLARHVEPTCDHVVGLDPTHRLDRSHFDLISQAVPVQALPIYGAGHGVLPLLTNSPARETLAELLSGQGSVAKLRHQVRADRRGSAGYLRRMGNKAQEKGHGSLFDFASAAQQRGFHKLAGKLRAPSVAMGHRPKLVVHCGLPKTGTSSLQAHFFSRAADYRKAEIFYPTVGADKKDKNHAWLSKQLRTASVDQLVTTLQSCPADCNTIFLSDESLFVEMPGLSDAALSALGEALEGYDVEIVLFERDCAQWMRSFYLQSVQNRRPGPRTKQPSARNLWQTTLDYPAFFNLPYCRDLLDFPTMRGRLQTAFGASKVTALDFQSGKDVVPMFCDAVGWPHYSRGPGLQRNQSITDTEAEILRQANAMESGQGRFIKALIGLPAAVDPEKMRQARVEKLVQQGHEFPWHRFVFCENPPLAVTPDSFVQTLAELRRKADSLNALLTE